MKKVLLGTAALAAAAIFMTSCGTTATVSANAEVKSTSTSKDELPPSRQVYEWQGMDVGVEKSPKWLKDAVLNDYSTYISTYKKPEGDAYRNSMGYGADVRSATMRADMAYARTIARELQQSVNVYAAEQARAGNLSDQTRQAIEEVTQTQSNAEITGHQKATEFWQRIISTDPISGDKTSQYVVYQIYEIPAKTWAQTTAKYVKQVLGGVPEELTPEQDFVKGLVGQMMQDARNQTVLTPAQAKQSAEINLKVSNAAASAKTPEEKKEAAEQVVAQAMQSDNVKVSSDVAKTAYESDNPVYKTAVTITSDDNDWAQAADLAISTLYPEL